MLAAGGNAVDAVLATAITLTARRAGIQRHRLGRLRHRLGRRAAARAECLRPLAGSWTPEYFRGGAVPLRGWNSVTVPGAVSAWVELHDRFGRLPFERLFEPAIGYGRDGFLVSPTVAGSGRTGAGAKVKPGFAEAFLPGGRAPAPGERFRFPDHAATLETIAATGGEAFYRGELAERWQAHSTANGGAMTASDLAAHRGDWVDPITSTTAATRCTRSRRTVRVSSR